MWVSKKFLTACTSSNCLGGRFVGFHFRGSPGERKWCSPARKPQLAGVVAGTLVALSTRKKSATWKRVSTKAVCFLCRVFAAAGCRIFAVHVPASEQLSHCRSSTFYLRVLFSCYYFFVEDWSFLEEEENYCYYIVGGSSQLF
jgi:hypothetical protein